MVICTIGFTQKNAETFFGLLREGGVRTLIDVRRNNTSQLAAFAKGEDLKFFLKEIAGIGYIALAPTEDLLKRYKKGETTWEEYEEEFNGIMRARNIKAHIGKMYQDVPSPVCLLCSEAIPAHCHRRLVAELFAEVFPHSEIVHLV